MKFYKQLEKLEEALQRFDSREEFEAWLYDYATEVHARIKEGDTEWLRAAEDDLGVLVTDMNSDFVIADPQDHDYRSVQHIIDAIQRRLYT